MSAAMVAGSFSRKVLGQPGNRSGSSSKLGLKFSQWEIAGNFHAAHAPAFGL